VCESPHGITGELISFAPTLLLTMWAFSFLKIKIMQDLEGEIWKPIIWKHLDYTGYYEVSNKGRVKSLRFNNKILKGTLGDNGYLKVTLRVENLQVIRKIHSVVVSSFIRNLKKGEVIDHINSDKLDNRLCNLRIVTHRFNCSREKVIKSKLPCGVGLQKRNKKNIRIQSRITVNNKLIFLGYYLCIQSASNAYKIALLNHSHDSELKDVFKKVDEYRISIGLKPIKRRVKN